MKKRNHALLIYCVVSIVVSAWTHFSSAGGRALVGPFAAGTVDPVPVPAGIVARPMPRKVSTEADGAVSGIASSAQGLNYSTGFEAADGFTTLGYIDNGAGQFPAGCGGIAFPCFGHTTSSACGGPGGAGCPGSVFTPSLITPTIDTANPATGTQHLRLTFDMTTRTNTPGFGLGVDARFPRNADLAVRAIDVNTVSVMVSVDAPFGSDYRIQPQSISQGFLATSALLHYSGSIYILDDLCGAMDLGFVPTGAFWNTTGGYQNYTVAMNPVGNVVNYFYGGAPIYSGCVIAGTNLEQFLIFSDNFPAPSGFLGRVDVDDLVLQSGDGVCRWLCGDGIIFSLCEQCEPDLQPNGCNPGHACGAVGTPEQCTCIRTCTLDEPCVLENGTNGPFYGPFDAQFGGIFTYESPDGVDAVSVELCGSTGADQGIFYWGSCADPADPGSANDDCYPGYSGADPSASCYGTVTGPNWESCTCHDNPIPGDNCYMLRIRPPAGAGQIHIEVNKKSICAGGHLGACCDTNGADTGCTDNVLSGDCVGPDKVWTENGKCASIQCACIPDCTGATCGDDGCGGSCGTCDDGNVCNGPETCNANRTCDAGSPLVCADGNVCNGMENCEPSSGCVPGTPLNCNDGDFCNGMEICVPSSGCASGTPPVCANGQFCDGVETCNPSSGCVAGIPVVCDDGLDCSVDSCDEATDACVADDSGCAIPTVSQWGLVVLTMLLLVAAKVHFGQRKTE